MRISRSVTALRTCLAIPFFFSFTVECVFCFWVGRSEKKQKKNWKRSLELGGPVSQRNIRGAWKQQDVVIKSTWWQWKKEKSTSWLNSSENSAKRMNDQNCMAKRENLGRSDDAKQKKKGDGLAPIETMKRTKSKQVKKAVDKKKIKGPEKLLIS